MVANHLIDQRILITGVSDDDRVVTVFCIFNNLLDLGVGGGVKRLGARHIAAIGSGKTAGSSRQH